MSDLLVAQRLEAIESRMDSLEREQAVIKKDVENHIPSAIARVQTAVDRLDTRLWWFLGIVPAVASAAAALVSSFVRP